MSVPSPQVSTTQNPPQSEPPSYFLVLISGLTTTALALFGVYWLAVYDSDFKIMGWYAALVIPIGAMMVGAVAATGYGLASWLSGIKIVRGLLWAVLFLQVGGYFGAECVEYRNLVSHNAGNSVGFLEYFDRTTRSYQWKGKDTTGDGISLGIWGYAFRALEVFGFAIGGVIVPAVLFMSPYCDPCKRYMKNRLLGILPASALTKKIKKTDLEGLMAYEAEQKAASESADGLLEMLRQMAAEGRADDFQNAVAPLKLSMMATRKLPSIYRMEMIYCKKCAAGWLRVWQVSGEGKQVTRTELRRSDISPMFVTTMLAKK